MYWNRVTESPISTKRRLDTGDLGVFDSCCFCRCGCSNSRYSSSSSTRVAVVVVVAVVVAVVETFRLTLSARKNVEVPRVCDRCRNISATVPSVRTRRHCLLALDRFRCCFLMISNGAAMIFSTPMRSWRCCCWTNMVLGNNCSHKSAPINGWAKETLGHDHFRFGTCPPQWCNHHETVLQRDNKEHLFRSAQPTVNGCTVA